MGSLMPPLRSSTVCSPAARAAHVGAHSLRASSGTGGAAAAGATQGSAAAAALAARLGRACERVDAAWPLLRAGAAAARRPVGAGTAPGAVAVAGSGGIGLEIDHREAGGKQGRVRQPLCRSGHPGGSHTMPGRLARPPGTSTHIHASLRPQHRPARQPKTPVWRAPSPHAAAGVQGRSRLCAPPHSSHRHSRHCRRRASTATPAAAAQPPRAHAPPRRRQRRCGSAAPHAPLQRRGAAHGCQAPVKLEALHSQ